VSNIKEKLKSVIILVKDNQAKDHFLVAGKNGSLIILPVQMPVNTIFHAPHALYIE
jgi:hypothetical protein